MRKRPIRVSRRLVADTDTAFPAGTPSVVGEDRLAGRCIVNLERAIPGVGALGPVVPEVIRIRRSPGDAGLVGRAVVVRPELEIAGRDHAGCHVCTCAREDVQIGYVGLEEDGVVRCVRQADVLRLRGEGVHGYVDPRAVQFEVVGHAVEVAGDAGRAIEAVGDGRRVAEVAFIGDAQRVDELVVRRFRHIGEDGNGRGGDGNDRRPRRCPAFIRGRNGIVVARFRRESRVKQVGRTQRADHGAIPLHGVPGGVAGSRPGQLNGIRRPDGRTEPLRRVGNGLRLKRPGRHYGRPTRRSQLVDGRHLVVVGRLRHQSTVREIRRGGSADHDTVPADCEGCGVRHGVPRQPHAFRAESNSGLVARYGNGGSCHDIEAVRGERQQTDAHHVGHPWPALLVPRVDQVGRPGRGCGECQRDAVVCRLTRGHRCRVCLDEPIRFRPGIEDQLVRRVAGVNDDVLPRGVREHDRGDVRRLDVGQVGSAVQVAPHEGRDVIADQLVPVLIRVVTAVLAVDAGGGHDADVRERVLQAALPVTQVDAVLGHAATDAQLVDVDTFDARVVCLPVLVELDETVLVRETVAAIRFPLVPQHGAHVIRHAGQTCAVQQPPVIGAQVLVGGVVALEEGDVPSAVGAVQDGDRHLVCVDQEASHAQPPLPHASDPVAAAVTGGH